MDFVSGLYELACGSYGVFSTDMQKQAKSLLFKCLHTITNGSTKASVLLVQASKKI